MEDQHLARVGRQVDDAGDEPAVVFGAAWRQGDEQRLDADAPGSMVEELAGTVPQVVLEDPAVAQPRVHVGEAVLAPGQALVHPRHLLRAVRQHVNGRRPGNRVERKPGQVRLGVGRAGQVSREQPGGTAGVQHHPAVGEVEGVQVVEDARARRLHVADLAGVRARPAHQAEAHRVALVPDEGELIARGVRRLVELDGPVEEDRPRGGDRAVVDDRVPAQWHLYLGRDLAGGIQHLVQRVVPLPEVRDPVQRPGRGVAVRVGRPRAAEGATEVAAGDGFQLVADLDRQHAALGEGVGAPAHGEHVRLRDVGLDEAGAFPVAVGLDPADGLGAGQPGQPQAARDLVIADEAVPVPQRLAVAQSHAHDHARAGEPVVGARVLRVERVGVGADAQETAVEACRDRAGDLQVEDRHLLPDRGERPGQVAVGPLGSGRHCGFGRQAEVRRCHVLMALRPGGAVKPSRQALGPALEVPRLNREQRPDPLARPALGVLPAPVLAQHLDHLQAAARLVLIVGVLADGSA